MNLYDNTDIVTLIKRCREYDDDAFDKLLRRYTPMMRKVVSSFSSTSYDSSEMFSEACVALHTAALRYDLEQGNVTFGLYARICIRNRLVDLLRLSEQKNSIAKCDIETLADDDTPESELVERERVDNILGSARLLLSDYEYNVLILHIQGYKTSAIAGMLCRTPKSVDNAKSRLFRRLRASLGGISDN